MKDIGGYFELELRQGEPMYANLIALNSARNALIYLIKAKKYKAISIPYFLCASVADAVNRFCGETLLYYYHVDAHFMPILDSSPVGVPLYYVNYYGLQEHNIRKLTDHYVVLDNSQAFYSPPMPRGDTIYCPRKFFGVSDGAYLQTNAAIEDALHCDISWEHASHLLKRIDCGAAGAYDLFQAADKALCGKPLMKMSRLTRRILSSIDYDDVKMKRKKNFFQVHRSLGNENGLSILLNESLKTDSFVPLCYPYMTNNADSLRNRLLENGIYVPSYWPELQESFLLNEFERSFVHQILCLPIDQRYGEVEMQKIVHVLKGIVL
jgi:hypothetical protein